MTVDLIPWVEKYRPKHLGQVSAQEEIVAVLKTCLESNNLPHCLFYGPPGTGKTSTILALAKELYGPQFFKSRVLELNASDERGIHVIREKVKNFAKLAVSTQSKAEGFPCPPFKIIILDEADSMTADAQSALRRTMETFSKVTRFCLICNYVSRIIDPLASRCAKFRFKPLDNSSILQRLNWIAQQEQVNASNESLQALVNYCEGDLRKAIMFLQSAHRLYKNELTADGMADIAGVIPMQVVMNVMNAWKSKDLTRIQGQVENVMRQGYSAAQLISQLMNELIQDETILSIQKAKMAQSLGKYDKALNDGTDEHLTLLALLSC